MCVSVHDNGKKTKCTEYWRLCVVKRRLFGGNYFEMRKCSFIQFGSFDFESMKPFYEKILGVPLYYVLYRNRLVHSQLVKSERNWYAVEFNAAENYMN